MSDYQAALQEIADRYGLDPLDVEWAILTFVRERREQSNEVVRGFLLSPPPHPRPDTVIRLTEAGRLFATGEEPF